MRRGNTLSCAHIAAIDPDVHCGVSCQAWAFCIIRGGVVMGDRCVIGSSCYVGAHAQMGSDVRLQHGVFVCDGVRFGSRVFVGPHVLFLDDKHPVVNNPEYRRQPPVVDDDVSIGGGALILPGVHLHRGCRIGAGAVVTHDVPAGVTVVGNPARALTSRNDASLALYQV